MKSGIVIVIIGFIVPVILNLISKEAGENTVGTKYDFTMMPARGLSYLGIIGAGFIVVVILLAIIVDQFRGFVVVGSIVFLLLCIMVILAPVKGFWDTTVKGDDITASRFWVVKEHAKISEIDYCKQVKGGINVYVKGHDKKALSIDSMCTNLNLFFDRMDEEGIEILPYER